MINLDNHSVRWYKNGRYHKGFTVRITIYPSLIIPWIFEQFKKGLSYREGKDLDDIPF